ncbi:MAG TPA: DinB family protein [Bryobacteraceae bacterium]|nr:DinB family protein [Bryobacteraceae bacterium]
MMTPGGACLTAEERAHLRQLLRDSEDVFLDLVGGVSDAQWTAAPADGGWSVQQTVEHLVLGEIAMLSRVEQALASPASADWASEDARKTRFLGAVLPDRSRKAVAPELLQPSRGWSREESLARFRKGRQRTLDLVAQLEGPVKDHLAEHPFPIFNRLNVHHWLLYIPLHNVRHNQQIAEAVKRIPA